MSTDISPTDGTPPIVCDTTAAPDTPAERIAEYRRLFAEALVGREWTSTGIRFRFRGDPDVEEWVRDLAAREQACCAFFSFAIERHDGELWWDAGVPDDGTARAVLHLFFALADT